MRTHVSCAVADIAAPTNLTATAVSPTAVALEWQRGYVDVSGYAVWFRESSQGDDSYTLARSVTGTPDGGSGGGGGGGRPVMPIDAGGRRWTLTDADGR